ncbi:hypothetical protein NIIDNTM18_49610 [Mycolicibacterium litorale]|uniref:Uncharacterized protein n=1 Tax=Mycolicibacterium litorale TaxID=758802 RepID=A0A6S6P720_9MYCO|nr:hypothetical protein NIIDNTM18_49610 [Mycolicibacterium litorale]
MVLLGTGAHVREFAEYRTAKPGGCEDGGHPGVAAVAVPIRAYGQVTSISNGLVTG